MQGDSGLNISREAPVHRVFGDGTP